MNSPRAPNSPASPFRNAFRYLVRYRTFVLVVRLAGNNLTVRNTDDLYVRICSPHTYKCWIANPVPGPSDGASLSTDLKFGHRQPNPVRSVRAMKEKRGRTPRKLPDLSVPVAPPVYKPPPAHACRVVEYSMYLSPSSALSVRFARYKGRIVDFSINHWIIVEGIRFDVSRIDTQGGTIHRHQFVRSTGEDIYGHRLIANIPAENSHQVVHDGFTQAKKAMTREWRENERRWRDG